MRQVLGAIAQFEKASTVARLAAARKCKREREGRCEGRKPLSETKPEVVALARKLRRRRPEGGQLSLRGVSKELAARGFFNVFWQALRREVCSGHVAVAGIEKGTYHRDQKETGHGDAIRTNKFLNEEAELPSDPRYSRLLRTQATWWTTSQTGR